MGSTGMGLLLEEHRGEIVNTWRQRVERELRGEEPALAFAVAPLLREMVLALGSEGGDRRSYEAWARCAVLVRSTASAGQLAREFKVLHRCVWDALRARGAPVSPSDRTSVDEWLDDALAGALDRLDRVRQRVASFERAPAAAPALTPPPFRRTTPPPLPVRRTPVVVAARRPIEPDAPLVEAEPLH